MPVRRADVGFTAGGRHPKPGLSKRGPDRLRVPANAHASEPARADLARRFGDRFQMASFTIRSLDKRAATGLTLIGRRDVKELFRDHAADQFERNAGSAWAGVPPL
jgi:hypothetical protein